jgi:hypothetical protein
MKEEKIEISKSSMEKLAYAKFLYDQGLSNSTKAYPFSTISILNYHDAVEFFIAIVMDVHKIKKVEGMMSSIQKIKDRGLEIVDDLGIRKLNKLRGSLKHAAVIPSSIELREVTMYVSNFLHNNCINLLKVDFDQISIAQLVDNEEIRSHLIQAIASYENAEINDVRFELSNAFWKTVNMYKDVSKDIYPMPFDFGSKDMSSAFFMGIDRNPYPSNYESLNKEFHEIYKRFQKVGEFVDAAKESVEAMRDAVEILSLGIDYRKFIIFSQSVPRAQRTMSGKYHVTIGGRISKSNFSEDDLQFCLNFIVECYFLLNS